MKSSQLAINIIEDDSRTVGKHVYPCKPDASLLRDIQASNIVFPGCFDLCFVSTDFPPVILPTCHSSVYTARWESLKAIVEAYCVRHGRTWLTA